MAMEGKAPKRQVAAVKTILAVAIANTDKTTTISDLASAAEAISSSPPLKWMWTRHSSLVKPGAKDRQVLFRFKRLTLPSPVAAISVFMW